MASHGDWKIPASVQPKPGDYVLRPRPRPERGGGPVHARSPEAFTAETLGTERAGNGVVIRADGLVLTVGYLDHGGRHGLAHHP